MTYLTDKQVASRYGIARPTLWRWVRDYSFPSPHRLTPGCTRFRLDEVEAWEAQRAGGA